MPVIAEIAAERKRQIDAEGWSLEHDDNQNTGQLTRAACAYAMNTTLTGIPDDDHSRLTPPVFWPWSLEWWKPKTRRRDLIRAGALIVAEIERLDRANGENND